MKVANKVRELGHNQILAVILWAFKIYENSDNHGQIVWENAKNINS